MPFLTLNYLKKIVKLVTLKRSCSATFKISKLFWNSSCPSLIKETKTHQEISTFESVLIYIVRPQNWQKYLQFGIHSIAK